MDFLSTWPTDIRLLLVGSALALLAGLFTATKKNELRYLALFSVLMVIAGFRIHQENRQDEAAQAIGATTSGKPAKSAGPR